METVADNSTIKLWICELEVGGLDLLFNFVGLDFHITASDCWWKPIFIVTTETHFLDLVLHFRTHKLGHEV